MSSKIFITGIILAAVSVTAVSVAAQDKGPGHHDRPSFAQLDADGNGEVSKEELAAIGTQRFDTADADGDGVLSREELLAKSKKKGEERVDKMLERFDANGDGGLSADELPKMPDRMFDRADADGNGSLSEAEFAEMKPHGKGHGKKYKQKN